MSDAIPDDNIDYAQRVMNTARAISERILSSDLPASDPISGANVIIARALMAADEAATKRERERCAEIASDFDWTGTKGDPRTGDVMPSAVCEDIAATILKGEA